MQDNDVICLLKQLERLSGLTAVTLELVYRRADSSGALDSCYSCAYVRRGTSVDWSASIPVGAAAEQRVLVKLVAPVDAFLIDCDGACVRRLSVALDDDYRVHVTVHRGVANADLEPR